VLDRCRVELFPGLTRRELLAMLRTLHKSGALLLVEGLDPERAQFNRLKHNNSSNISDGGNVADGANSLSHSFCLDTCYVVLDEGWVFGHLIASVVDDNQPWAATALPHAFGSTLGAPLHEARSAVAAVLFGKTVAASMMASANGNSGQLIDDCLSLLSAWDLASIVETAATTTTITSSPASSAMPQTRVLVLGSPAAVACLESMPQQNQPHTEEDTKPSLEAPNPEKVATANEGEFAPVSAVAVVDADATNLGSDTVEGNDNDGNDDDVEDLDVEDLDRWVRSVRFAVTSPLGGLGPGGYNRLQARLANVLVGMGVGARLVNGSSSGPAVSNGGVTGSSSNALPAPLSGAGNSGAEDGGGRVYTASNESVLVWSDALLVQHMCDQWGRQGQVLVQTAPNESIDVLVRLLPKNKGGDDDDDDALKSLSVLFDKVIAAVDGFSLSLRTVTLTPFRDLSSNRRKVSVWDCAARFRVALALDAPPKPVFVRRTVVSSPRRQNTKSSELVAEREERLPSSSGGVGAGEGDVIESVIASDALTVAAAAALEPPTVAYRENWSVASDLISTWGYVKCNALSVEQRVRSQGVATYEVLLPGPSALEFQEMFAKPGSYLAHALSRSSSACSVDEASNTDGRNEAASTAADGSTNKKAHAGKEAILVVADAVAPTTATNSSSSAAAAAATGSPNPAEVVVTAISTFDGHWRPLQGLAVAAVSERPWDPLCHNEAQCLTAEQAKSALASLQYPVYLTLVDPEEKVSVKEMAASASSSTASSDEHAASRTGASETNSGNVSAAELAASIRVLRMVVVATTRALGQGPSSKEGGSREWRWSGDAAPSTTLQWGMSIVETKPSVAKGSPFGEKMEVSV